MVRRAYQARWLSLWSLACLTSSAFSHAETGGGVVVRARAPLRHANEVPSGASSVVEREELSRPGQSAAQVLARLPSVQVTRQGDGSAFASASLRGASAAQTPVYLAGIRLNDDISGTADLSTLPLWLLHRIEVYRGNAPEKADQLGLGGAIFAYPVLPKRSEAQLGFGVGSFGERSGSLRLGLAHGEQQRVSVLVGRRAAARSGAFHYLDDGATRFDSTDDTDRVRLNADSEEVDDWFVLRTGRGATRVLLLYNAFEREQGLPGVSRHPARFARRSLRRRLAGLDARLRLAPDTQLELTCDWLSTRTETQDPYAEINGLLTPSRSATGERGHQRVALIRDLGKLSLRVSSDYSRETVAIHTQTAASGTGEDLDALRLGLRGALGATLRVTPSTELSGLGVVEHRQLRDASSRTETSQAWSGRVGVLQRIAHFELLGNLGRYVRQPTLGELYGTSPLVQGNPRLEEERGVSVDLGVRRAEALRWLEAELAGEGFLYFRDSTNTIGFRRSSLGIVRPYNTASSRTYGAELALGASALKHVSLRYALSWLDAQDTSGDRLTKNARLPFLARLSQSLRGELYAALPSARIQRAYLALDWSQRASRYADRAGLVTLPSQQQLDLEWGGNWLVARGRTRVLSGVAFALRNLADSTNVDLLGAPLPGRSFYADFRIAIED